MCDEIYAFVGALLLLLLLLLLFLHLFTSLAGMDSGFQVRGSQSIRKQKTLNRHPYSINKL